MPRGGHSGHSARVAAGLVVGVSGLLTACLGAALLAILLAAQTPSGCAPAGSGSPAAMTAGRPLSAGAVALGAPGVAQRVGASEYGGPGDRSSGTVGASGVSLPAHPDSYAELGGTTFQTATAMGGLAYLTPLRLAWGGHAKIAYKRDFGLGGGPVAGLPRVIDLWWQLAQALRIPYERGLWSGAVTVARPPAAGAGNVLGQAVSVVGVNPGAAGTAPITQTPCPPAVTPGLPLTSGPRAQRLADGQAQAPATAPVAVRGMIAAGNQIVGRPYLYGAGHGLPLNQLAPAYDCSSSVAHLLYGGGQLAVAADPTSGTLESFGSPGPGRWVTIYASGAHVFMYVAGLRWDTWNAAGPQDGTGGIGWHPLVRSAGGFVARHPVGL
jgi:hypothetical protein